MTERTARLDELLREEISEVVRREVDDPRIGFVTVTDVEVSADLSHASVWVSVIGSAEQRKEALRALSHAMPFVRSRLGRLRLKRIPALHVKEDDSAERGTRVLRILEAIEHGSDTPIADVEETLPTPTGNAALEPVDESAPKRTRRRPRGRR